MILFKLERITRGVKDPYLTRLIVLKTRAFAIFLHKFLGSDDECLHNHPWPFISIILAGGYWEVVEHTAPNGTRHRSRTWCGPGSVLVNPATHTHRVELEPGITPITLVLTGPKTQPWGFFTRFGFLTYNRYDFAKHCS